jgi:uncharacterized membrane protein
MALDHARDFFGYTSFDPENLAESTPPLFFTRWITHFCAPAFFLLAGAAAAIPLAQGKPRAILARTLLVRGVWLIVLEFTAVRAAWFVGFAADVTYRFAFVQVIWALGWSMIALAALIYLPRTLMFALTFAMIAGHNALDSVTPESLGPFGAVWKLLHVSAPISWGADRGHTLFVRYPLIPWPGVMALGFLAAPLFHARNRRRLIAVGAAFSLAFVLLRLLNAYGDPVPWTPQPTPLATLLSFINTQKYPPSLLFLCMTLGPALAIVPLLERLPAAPRSWLLAFGQASMFFYIAHLFVLQFAMIATALLTHGVAVFQWTSPPNFGLPAVYAAWIGAVAALYIPCRRLAAFKQRRRPWWGPLL